MQIKNKLNLTQFLYDTYRASRQIITGLNISKSLKWKKIKEIEKMLEPLE